MVEYLVTEGANFLESLEANCIADIEHPHLKEDFSDGRRGTRGHNPVMLGLFANWYSASFVRRRQKQTREFIADGKLVEGEYFAPEIQLFGDIHSFSIINRAQMAPLSERDIVFVNDLYSDEDTRFKDRQRRSDKILNFLNFPAWIRPLMRAFLLDKVTNGELAPSTAYSMLGRLRLFARFLGQEGICSPGEVNELAMERYLAWGNARDVHGKNWYTDVVQLMRSASILLPDEWSQIALDRRATWSALEKLVQF